MTRIVASPTTRELALALIEERLADVSQRIFNVRRAAAVTDEQGQHPYRTCAQAREHDLQETVDFLLERWQRVHDS